MRFAEAKLGIRHDLELFKVGHNVTKYQICSMILQEREVRKIGLQFEASDHGGWGRGGYFLIMGISRWIQSHFHDWFEYNGVTFSIQVLEWSRTLSEFQGKTVLHIFGQQIKRTRMFVLQVKSEAFFILNIRQIHEQKVTKLGSRKSHICPKVTKMGSIIGHRLDYDEVGALRGQRHIPSKS